MYLIDTVRVDLLMQKHILYFGKPRISHYMVIRTGNLSTDYIPSFNKTWQKIDCWCNLAHFFCEENLIFFYSQRFSHDLNAYMTYAFVNAVLWTKPVSIFGLVQVDWNVSNSGIRRSETFEVNVFSIDEW